MNENILKQERKLIKTSLFRKTYQPNPKLVFDAKEHIPTTTKHKLVTVDSAQIEARTLAWMANENEILNAFRHGRDVYSEFALQNLSARNGGAIREVITAPPETELDGKD